MAQEEIEISIDSMGQVTVRTIGIKGSKCLDYGELLVQLLGREESRQLTSEYYEASQTSQTHLDVHRRR